MGGRHLKRRGSWWHYCWVVPKAFHDVGRRRLISFSLKTQDFALAKLQAAQISLDLDCECWRALARGRPLKSVDADERFRASAETQTACGFAPKESPAIDNDELLNRLRFLVQQERPATEQKAVLGLIGQPKLSLAEAFERFWDHIRDEWMRLDHDQQRVKRNIYLKAMRNFDTAAGAASMHG